MDFNNITIGEIVVAITAIGVVSGFLFKVFSALNQINENRKNIESLESRLEYIKSKNEKQKEELLDKVEHTNVAVNLLCSAISAMIDSELGDSNNKEELRAIKHKLDEKKEIV